MKSHKYTQRLLSPNPRIALRCMGTQGGFYLPYAPLRLYHFASQP